MAVQAAREALAGETLDINEIDAIICSTTTPTAITPSLACQIHHRLFGRGVSHDIPCYDLLAACSGYIYALSSAYDFVHSRDNAKVLVITAEVFSRVIDKTHFDTAILFGDAATATVVYGASCRYHTGALLHRPVVSARGEDGRLLALPLSGNGHLAMDGKRIFVEAIREMTNVMRRACAEVGITIEELDLLVPHQANGRIIEAIRARLALPPDRVLNCIQHMGNTSSSSIPVALGSLKRETNCRKVGLCAFGGGLTSGAAIVEFNPLAPR
jgi:2-oxoisovalerate dehydrogenase E1 component